MHFLQQDALSVRMYGQELVEKLRSVVATTPTNHEEVGWQQVFLGKLGEAQRMYAMHKKMLCPHILPSNTSAADGSDQHLPSEGEVAEEGFDEEDEDNGDGDAEVLLEVEAENDDFEGYFPADIN